MTFTEKSTPVKNHLNKIVSMEISTDNGNILKDAGNAFNRKPVAIYTFKPLI